MPLSSLPVAMKMVRGDEKVRGGEVERRGAKQPRGKDAFVCIPVDEMESYYRYSQCCQQLQQSELECVFGVCLTGHVESASGQQP